MNPQAQSLLSELDSTLAKAPPSRHALMLRQLTQLFVAGAPAYSAEQLEVFEAVFQCLTEGAEPRALIEVSGLLASVDGAPADLIVRLSNTDDIAVAGPVLEKSNVLHDGVLVGIAKTKSQGHLLAIAGRTRINDVVTDVLVARGNPDVKYKVTANVGALFSETGFARLVSEARMNKEFAVLLAKRDDILPELKPFLDQVLGR
jgi:uncharacterized protein (DUF2336 family)